jgi:Flp pilus assembly protein TadB
MLTALMLAVGVVAGAPPLLLLIMATVVFRPWWFLVGVAAWAGYQHLRRLRSRPDDEAQFLLGLASELRAGASLRSALSEASARVPELDLKGPVRRAVAGRPMAEVAGSLTAALPVNGRLASAAVTIASATGAGGAGMFTDLALRATRHADLGRERRALTAQARLTALLIGLAPLAVLGLMAVTGRLDSISRAGGIGPLVLAAGLCLEVAGIAVVWGLIRKAGL